MAAADVRNAKLGLCLTPEVLTAVFVRNQKGSPKIVAIGTVSTPPATIDGSIIRDPVRLGQAIRALLRQMGASPRSAAVAMPAGSCQMRSLRFPDAPDRERRAIVRGELEHASALQPGTGAFDFVWVSAPPEEGKHEADAFVFYTDDAPVEALLEAMRAAGLELDFMEPASVSAMRGYIATLPASTSVVMVSPTRDHTDIMFHDGAHIRYMRRVPGGWREVIGMSAAPDGPEDLAPATSAFDLGSDAFAQPTGSGATIGSTSIPPPSASREFLATEVARSFAYFSREYRDVDEPNHVAVLAPAAVAADVRLFIGGFVDIPVPDVNPLGAMETPAPLASSGREDDRDSLLAAVGAAIADPSSAIPRVDAARQEARTIQRRKAPGGLALGLGLSSVWVILGIVASVGLMMVETQSNGERARIINEITAESARRAGPRQRADVYKSAVIEANKSRIPAASVMGRVALSYTPGMAVTNIKVAAGGKTTIEGTAVNTESMEAFAKALANGGTVMNPMFDQMRQDDKGNVTFRIQARAAVAHAAAAPPAESE